MYKSLLALALPVLVLLNAPEPADARPSIRIRAKVVGRCDAYFENRRSPKQTLAVPNGEKCVVRIRASKVIRKGNKSRRVKRTPLNGAHFTLSQDGYVQSDNSVLNVSTPIASGQVNDVGVVQLPFTYDKDICFYNVAGSPRRWKGTLIRTFAGLTDECFLAFFK